ncbi:antitoxin Xre/MbcA/ParS toxin-binding domain-containing protein [Pseudomonas sp. NPDC090964]|uniref:MbcA/ParS/Xre antitoxin family protein n=1 Tax=unclassified Pseudomonas TaxID=196821 RepID=UPI000812A8F7|nr:MbcA/ParS/Xre antitoxin family protein [Pseudomonas sp. 44 R 15]CRM32773.1 putative toxin-antitoxin system antitoxin component [Pseudomonas sp. 44 R 15]
MQNLDLVWQQAERVFGDKAKAAAWLSTPRQLFGGVTAIEFVKDQESLQRVIEVLTQIEHGLVC